jgi:hypothetical protein
VFGFIRSLRRRRLAKRPLPPAWAKLIDERLAFVATMAPDQRARFLTHLKVFAWEKAWVGVEGVVITDEIKVVVAGAAARLARNLPLGVYDDLGTIIIHPGHLSESADGVILGMAHRLGAVSLSWDSVKHGIANAQDGKDVALHELAHALDVADGEFDGTPPLEVVAERRAWASACSVAFGRLRAAARHDVMRAYGATNEAEFFAVATEVFFEKPRQLAKREPALYAALVQFYGFDPAQ